MSACLSHAAPRGRGPRKCPHDAGRPGRFTAALEVTEALGIAAAPPGCWTPPEGAEPSGPGQLMVSVAEAAACRSGRGRPGWRRGAGDRGEAGGGDEEVLDALAGHLAGVVVGEGVQRVAVVGDLAAVDGVDHG